MILYYRICCMHMYKQCLRETSENEELFYAPFTIYMYTNRQLGTMYVLTHSSLYCFDRNQTMN